MPIPCSGFTTRSCSSNDFAPAINLPFLSNTLEAPSNVILSVVPTWLTNIVGVLYLIAICEKSLSDNEDNALQFIITSVFCAKSLFMSSPMQILYLIPFISIVFSFFVCAGSKYLKSLNRGVSLGDIFLIIFCILPFDIIAAEL